jgi:hypothetical protein
MLSADLASIYVSALFFSAKLRQWSYRKRWGALPAATSHLYSVVLADMDDPSGGSIRPQPSAILRNPFDPRARETLGESPLVKRHQDEFHRPTFRRSTILQQRIAEYESTLAGLALTSPELGERARSGFLPGENALLKPRFEGFRLPSFHQAQLS